MTYVQTTDSATGSMTEMSYESGALKRRTITNTDNSKYEYDGQGILRESIISGSGLTTYNIYDMNGNLSSYYLQTSSYYEQYDAGGNLVKKRVYGEADTYTEYKNGREVYEPYFNNTYRYDAKTKVWYLNDVPYDGPVPVILAELKLEKEIVWYPNNTVCSFGPQFRDVKPGLTDLWYMFTPMDLSRDGTQTYELIGGNMYVLGHVHVTVYGDSVTVTYDTIKGKYGHIYMKSEYLNFFSDLDSVTAVAPEKLGAGFRFGQPISIKKDLGGDTNVLMFVRNVATFCNFVDKNTLLQRYYKNYPSRQKLRDEMLIMMDGAK